MIETSIQTFIGDSKCWISSSKANIRGLTLLHSQSFGSAKDHNGAEEIRFTQMRYVHPKLYYSNLKGDFRKLKDRNAIRFPHTLVLTSIYKNTVQIISPRASADLGSPVLTFRHSPGLTTLKLQNPPEVFFKVSAAVHLISLPILINGWNLLMLQPWSLSQPEVQTILCFTCNPPPTNQSKPNEGAQEKRMRQTIL